MPPRVRLLGPIEVVGADGVRLAPGGRRARALLAVLALDAGRWVPVSRLIDGVYGAELPGSPRHAIEAQVSRLRSRGVPVEHGPAGYRLALDPDAVDVHRFTRLAAPAAPRPVDHGEIGPPDAREGRFLHDQLGSGGAEAVGETAERARSAGEAAAERLRAALDLWRGPALADVGEAPFAVAAAAELEERRLAALEELAEAELALGRHRSLAVSLTSAAAEQPLRERLHGQLMRALAADGRRAEALAVFARLRGRLDDELGVSPSPELVELNAALLRDPVGPAAPRPLPAQLTGFVGRAAEVVRVRELLASGRLVTLTGPGGVGKTRLAIEAAGEADVGEVCFADLDGVDDGASLPAVLLGALGLPAAGLFPIRSGPADATARLVAALADRRILLVLDTCDRMVAELAALLRRLLTAAPGVRVLATGREPFGITGEQVWPVQPLPPHEAERLFRERAAAADPSRPMTPATTAEDGRVVRRICAALDGLPLAIELAAARLRTLVPAELAARIDDRFALLSRGDRTAAPRHRTLHAVTAWSWDLLTPHEQRFAARVSVYAGGVTAETAAAIEPRPDDLLAGLTEKSLLQRVGDRYRMLSTVREFCAARLTAADDAHAVHARTFLELAETAEPHLRGHDQLVWLARLDAEHDNLAAALRWSADHDPALGLRLLTALTWHGHLRGQTGERAAVAARLAEASADRGEAYALAVATAAAGRPAAVPYPPGPPRSPYLPLVRFMTEGPHAGVEFAADAWSQAFARVAIALRHGHDGDQATAEKELTAAHAAFAALGDRWGRAVALEQLGAVGVARDLFRELGAVADLERLDGHVSDR
ncbi:AfsR/SARP family transcriptional regulator [Jiangella ureilytica]|uniref:AfsR/SARP family transcriptional regulator n=1 Tax=Jiangella ureilytica TaxID=2530374 RepID=A0A4R4RQY3_9ACTN|nr:BTAD domain-containing putative transcriptional regulator [Jiangella ureilytica]TDC51966.1 AfsR/SARP family transcriptional regulator [Jiangella ureilytica]